jgi:hypothetical protein
VLVTKETWLADARGRWDGDTLVVETTSFNSKGDQRVRNLVLAGSEHSHLVERFTRVDADTIDNRFTLSDPATFTRSWTAAIPLTRDARQHRIVEYACHEGNEGLLNIFHRRARKTSGRSRGEAEQATSWWPHSSAYP